MFLYLRQVILYFLIFTFFAVNVCPLSAQPVLNLPQPGIMVSPSRDYQSPRLQGITIDPENSLQFDFIVNPGDVDNQLSDQHVSQFVQYFLTALTVPNEDFWVNLSPNENEKIIEKSFGQTVMGRNLLAQDYLLKQLTSSLMYPENELGQRFWKRVYGQAYEQLGTTQIPLDTFHKVWIIPGIAEIIEKNHTAYIIESELDVRLEDKNHLSQAIRDIILPEIKYEINHGQNFSQLRQIYHSMILAMWYKQSVFDGEQTFLGQMFTDQNKIDGINTINPEETDSIYQQYLKAYNQGVYNYIKEEFDLETQETIPRQYFSGGFSWEDTAIVMMDEAMLDSDHITDMNQPKNQWRVDMTPIRIDSAYSSDDSMNAQELKVLVRAWEFVITTHEGYTVIRYKPVRDGTQLNWWKTIQGDQVERMKQIYLEKVKNQYTFERIPDNPSAAVLHSSYKGTIQQSTIMLPVGYENMNDDDILLDLVENQRKRSTPNGKEFKDAQEIFLQMFKDIFPAERTTDDESMIVLDPREVKTKERFYAAMSSLDLNDERRVSPPFEWYSKKDFDGDRTFYENYISYMRAKASLDEEPKTSTIYNFRQRDFRERFRFVLRLFYEERNQQEYSYLYQNDGLTRILKALFFQELSMMTQKQMEQYLSDLWHQRIGDAAGGGWVVMFLRDRLQDQQRSPLESLRWNLIPSSVESHRRHIFAYFFGLDRDVNRMQSSLAQRVMEYDSADHFLNNNRLIRQVFDGLSLWVIMQAVFAGVEGRQNLFSLLSDSGDDASITTYPLVGQKTKVKGGVDFRRGDTALIVDRDEQILPIAVTEKSIQRFDNITGMAFHLQSRGEINVLRLLGIAKFSTNY